MSNLNRSNYKNDENDENADTLPEITKQNEDNSAFDLGLVATTNAKHSIHCLTIIGQIEGHYILPPQNKTTKYEHIIPALVAIEEDFTIEGLLIILNTVGGDVEAGLAIAELIAGMKKPTVSIVVGGGHSIGVPLAVSAKVSFIVPSGTMTIHPVRMSGMVLGIPQTLSYFNKMQDRIVNFVTNNSKITEENFRRYMMEKDELVMDVGTVLDGKTAVKAGLIDKLGGLSDAISELYSLIEKNKAETDKIEENSKQGTQKSSENSQDSEQKSHRRTTRKVQQSNSSSQNKAIKPQDNSKPQPLKTPKQSGKSRPQTNKTDNQTTGTVKAVLRLKAVKKPKTIEESLRNIPLEPSSTKIIEKLDAFFDGGDNN